MRAVVVRQPGIASCSRGGGGCAWMLYPRLAEEHTETIDTEILIDIIARALVREADTTRVAPHGAYHAGLHRSPICLVGTQHERAGLIRDCACEEYDDQPLQMACPMHPSIDSFRHVPDSGLS